MTTFYNHQQLEKKWQANWAKSELYQAKGQGKKKYILDMFPYPSGEGLHVGHPESYTATDIMARYLRLQGFDVLHPMGWDAFGLPAENFAIKSGIHPKETTAKAIENFRKQIKMLGFSYDWTREVNTASPDYYKWTQWLFLQLYKKGLAYKKKAPVNWCPSCQTVLANEQVVDGSPRFGEAGKCERCSSKVVQKDLEQWFFKVTQYAEELLNKIDEMDWSDALKAAQKNWIGKSEGLIFSAPVKDMDIVIETFSAHFEACYADTFVVIAPDHPLLLKLVDGIEDKTEILDFAKKIVDERANNFEEKEPEGIFTGRYLVDPLGNGDLPIWVASYALANYGTGVVKCSAHDERDFQFAKKYGLKLKPVLFPQDQNLSKKVQSLQICFSDMQDGILTEPTEFKGKVAGLMREKIIEYCVQKGFARPKKVYKIRDWLISRQRYWGAPIPIIYCSQCARLRQGFGGQGQWPVPEKDLPVLLPDDVDFRPTGESPLARSKSFHKVKCPKCGAWARRESDTMDTFVCSSWYFLRYVDPHNTKAAFDKKKVKYWLPVDLYIGGMEHAVGHLIYSRFIVKALRDAGYLDFDEPFLKIRNQGIILAEDGRKMSKRWHNVINPDEVVEEYGADTMRMYEMFMGPLEDTKPWNQKGIIGVRRFLEKIYKFVTPNVGAQYVAPSGNGAIEKLLHKTIKKVTEDIEALRFNTAISAMMIFMNEISNFEFRISNELLEKFLIILSPFAPHLAEELWSKLGHQESIFKEKWPTYDKKLVIDEEVNIAIQVNGKLRDVIKVERGLAEKEVRAKIEGLPNIQKYLAGQEIKKFIYIQDRLVNIVL